ncbi:MAG: cytochrome bd ubiquinol oxidase subunit [Chloroflexota bacterium]|jgi:cytochrome d ubiquinol oxidase subunit I|nr:cytochrome bd ubiquinol oxidase subunit [Chloroflexota bacterium]
MTVGGVLTAVVGAGDPFFQGQAPGFGGVAGTRLAIAIIALTHILSAGLISGGGQLAPVVEWLGYVRRREDYDRLARGMAKFLVYYFAISASIAFIFVTVLLTGLWGHFWTSLVRVMFVPLVLELFAFLFEIVFAYLWYYSWEPLREHKRLHLALGGLLVMADFLQVLMINVVASYMETPTQPNDLFKVILNPTFYPLQVHRIVANLAYIGFAVAAFAGWRFLRTKDPEQKTFYDWAGSFGMLVGIELTLLQPLVGYSYAKEIQLHSYGSWYRMMLGNLSTVFLFQMVLLGIMLLVAALYFARRLRSDRAPGHRALFFMSIAMIVTTVFAAMPYHLAFTYTQVQAAGLDRPFWQGGLINPLGAMLPWKVLALMAYSVLAVAAVTWYLRGLRGVRWGNAGRGEQRLLVASAFLTAGMIITMGVIRENGRQPDVIYGQMSVQGQQPTAAPSAPPPPQ